MTADNPSIGSRPLEQVHSLSESASVGAARLQVKDWLLVTRGDHAVGLFHRDALSNLPDSESLASLVLRSRGFVMAPAGSPVADVLRSPAVRELRPAGVVVFNGSEPRGVWSEDELLEVAAGLGQERLAGDVGLPGEIDIARIVRTCKHAVGSVTCQSVRTFAEKPDPMPACADPGNLGHHSFEW